MNYRCYEIILRVEHFYTDWKSCEVLTGYLSLVVTGRIRDIGQNVLQSYFQTKNSKSLRYIQFIFYGILSGGLYLKYNKYNMNSLYSYNYYMH